MAAAKLYCTYILLLYLQGNYAQQGLTNSQNVINNGIGFQQQVPQRTNTPNNINQIPNGGLNFNLPQQCQLQQGNLQQPLSANLQENVQQPCILQANLQQQSAPGSLGNMQFPKQGFAQLPPGSLANPSKSPNIAAQFNNDVARQNAQNTPQQHIGQISNAPMPQTQNTPCSSNPLAEIPALKGQPSLFSIFASQNAAAPQQNQQMAAPNFNPTQNQLTDVQKQFLVRALQSQTSGQNQPGLNFVQTQIKVAGGDNRPAIAVQGQPMSSQQPQAIVAPMGNIQPQYITVQAQPLNAYLQNQPSQVEEEPSIMSLILSELQPSDSQFIYPAYPVQKKGSKSNLKTLIPLIINLLREKNGCSCQNCGCPNNGCGNNSAPEPAIFSGYSSQKNYSQKTEESPTKPEVAEEKSKNDTKDKEEKNVKKNTVNVDSEEISEENDSEYVDDSEGD